MFNKRPVLLLLPTRQHRRRSTRSIVRPVQYFYLPGKGKGNFLTFLTLGLYTACTWDDEKYGALSTFSIL